MMHFTLPSLSAAPPTAPPPLTPSASLSFRCAVAEVDVRGRRSPSRESVDWQAAKVAQRMALRRLRRRHRERSWS